MAILSGAMVAMFSSSKGGTVSPQISQQAYYVAESGKRYAIQAFLNNQDNDTAFVNALRIGQSFPINSDRFAISMEGYWFNKMTSTSNFNRVTVSPFGDFPGVLKTGSLSGYIQIPGISGLVRYTSSSYNGGTKTVTFNLPSNVTGTSSAGKVFPAFPAAAQTVDATEMGEDPDSGDVIIPVAATQTNAFPAINGIVSLADTAGNTWVLIYRKKNANGRLEGVQYPVGMAFPPGGIAVAANTAVVLGRHAIFTSTGTSGTGSFQSTQTIRIHQPLNATNIFKKIQGGIDFNSSSDINKLTSLLGTHGINDNALQVLSTNETYSYTSFSGGDPVFQQESLSAVKWSDTSFPVDFLKTIWEKSAYKLSYDLQVKIKFTETEDDTDIAPVNHPGCYMPGLSFRVNDPKVGNVGQATYYGLSLMRGIKGLEQHPQSGGGGCGGSAYTYTENDDITDNFFTDHNSTSSAAAITACPGSSFTPTNWNDDPPLDGIPYLLLWQKDISTDAAGNPVGTGGCGGGGDYSPWEWLAYMPLVEVQPVTVYRYTYAGIDSYYEGQIAASNRPSHVTYSGESFVVWKLKDKFGVLGTTVLQGVQILGSPGPSQIVVRDPATVVKSEPTTAYPHGLPMSKFNGATVPVGYIWRPADYMENYKSVVNYKIYPKAWVTLMVRVYEMEGDLDCNPATGNAGGLERVNAVSAFISDPDGAPGNVKNPKDSIRLPHPRGIVKWPEKGDYFTTIIWKGLDANGSVHADTGYTSKLVPNPGYTGCGGTGVNIKLVEKGFDNVHDPLEVYTATYTTQNYFQAGSAFNNSEFGLHTLGISSDPSKSASDRETVYFDDFYWSIWEGGASGIFPGLQEQ
ncbi:MAG: hypothetical protein V1793_11935 [Pseudomonadota bacterium]